MCCLNMVGHNSLLLNRYSNDVRFGLNTNSIAQCASFNFHCFLTIKRVHTNPSVLNLLFLSSLETSFGLSVLQMV